MVVVVVWARRLTPMFQVPRPGALRRPGFRPGSFVLALPPGPRRFPRELCQSEERLPQSTYRWAGPPKGAPNSARKLACQGTRYGPRNPSRGVRSGGCEAHPAPCLSPCSPSTPKHPLTESGPPAPRALCVPFSDRATHPPRTMCSLNWEWSAHPPRLCARSWEWATPTPTHPEPL